MPKEKVRVDETGHVLNVHTEDGAEIPDPRPMSPPVNFKRQPPLHERIRAMVRDEYNRVSASRVVETPEDADDFIIGDDEGDDPRESRFALMPGHEWEDNYEPPSDFTEMRNRLIEAGWSPPAPGQENSAVKPRPGDASANSLDAATTTDNKATAGTAVAKPPK